MQLKNRWPKDLCRAVSHSNQSTQKTGRGPNPKRNAKNADIEAQNPPGQVAQSEWYPKIIRNQSKPEEPSKEQNQLDANQRWNRGSNSHESWSFAAAKMATKLAQTLSQCIREEGCTLEVGTRQIEATVSTEPSCSQARSTRLPIWCARKASQWGKRHQRWVSVSTAERQKGQLADSTPREDLCMRSAVMVAPCMMYRRLCWRSIGVWSSTLRRETRSTRLEAAPERCSRISSRRAWRHGKLSSPNSFLWSADTRTRSRFGWRGKHMPLATTKDEACDWGSSCKGGAAEAAAATPI